MTKAIQMKKITFLTTFSVLFSFLLMVSSCGLFDIFEDDCSQEVPRISRTFLMKIQIKYKDGEPFMGKTDYWIVRERCDGSQSGYHESVCTPDATGTFSDNYEPLYSYSDKADKVFFQFTAHYEKVFPHAELTITSSDTYSYEEAMSQSDEYDEIHKTYTLTIPTNADGTE